MKMPILGLLILLCSMAQAQERTDTVGMKVVTLSEVVVKSNLNVPAFIEHVKNDSSFYKAFKNLRLLGHTTLHDIRMLDKNGEISASFIGKTVQHRKDSCRTMETLDEKVTGDYYDLNRDYNYYTAKMYASLFFTVGKICGENNIIGNEELTTANKTGIEKHKEQLKMLFFNPGRKIEGIPFMSAKTELYGDNLADSYDMSLDIDYYNGYNCYIFTQKVKPGKESNVVVDEMVTWFNKENMQVVARNYKLKYNAMVYDFDVEMEVKMGEYNGLTVPTLVKYNGNWKVVGKKREHGSFTAVITNFNPGD